MVGITSLGLHVPSGVNYLIEEKVLPENPPSSSYVWQIFPSPDESDVIDELVYVDTHVVWSRGDRVHRVFSFGIEKENVQQALFASFARQEQDQESLNQGTTGPLNVKKRAKKGQTPVSAYGNHELPGVEQSSAPSGRESVKRIQRDRALVVVLKSHMQIFFLTGTRSIVPLNFDVDKVFALSEGIVIQRRTHLSTKPQTSQLPPKTPINSFVLSQSFVRSPDALPLPHNMANSDKEPKLVKSLFRSALSDHERQIHANVPFHCYLPDPFTELGVLSEASSGTDRGPTAYDSEELFPKSERIVYMSGRNEALNVPSDDVTTDLLLAVSLNIERKLLNVWHVSKYRSNKYWKPRRRVTSYDSERKRRRRSSQPGTGAATPNPRHSIGPRESFAGNQESFTGRDQVKDDEDLAAQLDPAFQNPRAPGTSSRRISSMLARSDLTGMDMYTDGVVNNAGPSRRIPSSTTTAAAGRSFRHTSDRHPDLRSSIRSDHGPQELDNLSDEDESRSSDPRQEFKKLMSFSKGLRIDFRMKLLYSIDIDASIQQDLRVFVTLFRQRSARSAHLLLSVVSPPGGELLLFQLQADCVHVDAIGAKQWQCRMTDIKRVGNVTDACPIIDGKEESLAVLSKSKEGQPEISLQSPRSASIHFPLSDRLMVNFPYNLQFSSTLPQRRSTGLRRLIDSMPLPLTTMQCGPGNSQLVITDKQNVRHRLHLRSRPKSMLVKTCIDICQTVFGGTEAVEKSFLACWLETYRFVMNKQLICVDSEWTAFVLLLFSLCRPSSVPEHSRTPTRTTRKKGGLLRSSSGATTDMTDYHGMITSESGSVSSRPSWTENSAWAWTLEDKDKGNSVSNIGLGISPKSKSVEREQTFKKSSFILECISWGQEFRASGSGSTSLKAIYDNSSVIPSKEGTVRSQLVSRILVGLHLYREELKLSMLTVFQSRQILPVLTQLGGWLGWSAWSWEPFSAYMTEDLDLQYWCFDEKPVQTDLRLEPPSPPSILNYVSQRRESEIDKKFPSFEELCPDSSTTDKFERFTPRLLKVTKLVQENKNSNKALLQLVRHKDATVTFIETLPEGIAAPLRSCMNLAQSNPDPEFDKNTLELLGRDDLGLLLNSDQHVQPTSKNSQPVPIHCSLRDNHAICRTVGDDEHGQTSKTDASTEIDRAAVTRMIFKEDQRVREVQKLLHPLEPPVVRCDKEPDWSEQEFLEAEQELAKVVAIRTLSVCAGRGMLVYGGRSPLLTERFPTHGFTLSCFMKPSNNSVTAEKEIFTEEKVSWAFFHAGAEAGLSISRNSKGIDTSWIVFNKPPELNNRHAGFLLALGLNGHLKNIAKWVAYKYLTPKHTMTSIGLLLGLAASYIGTMDSLIIRLLSVHVIRMLPPGAAELNLSALTQTTGILSLGLLYCETQHRRMSEIMLSEMENTDQDENENPMNDLRDEGYRLAAGFALGFINLGQGKNLRGLHDMHIVERLLSLAISTKKVDLVHVLDKASAAATIAIALIFMKSDDEALARKIDIPDTTPQFEYVRPDVFLIRTVARHLIMWSKIEPTETWISSQLPSVFRKAGKLEDVSTLEIKDLPLYNTIAGLCFTLGLRYAGTANTLARDLLILRLDQFMRLARLPALTYDHRLTRTTLRNCQDTVALAAACVMAGTGDITLLRRLRSLHGRTDPETPYGSHMAIHQAIGTLFLAGGTHTFKNTYLAVAALLCAFYPLFPASVLDNKGHLQAFRHLWVLAVEPRCLVVRSVDSHRPISMPIGIQLTDGSELSANAPCLLPSLELVSKVTLTDPRYWRVELDLSGNNAAHLLAFARHQSMFARRKGAGAHEAGASAFSTAVQAYADEDAAATAMAAAATTAGAAGPGNRQLDAVAVAHGSLLDWVFDLPSFRSAFTSADRSLALPPGVPLVSHAAARTSPVDDRLMLGLAVDSSRADRLWSLRMLFAWADSVDRENGRRKGGGGGGRGGGEGDDSSNGDDNARAELGWLEREVISGLKAELTVRIEQMKGA